MSTKANIQKSKKRKIKRVTLSEKELRQLKKTVTEDATKKSHTVSTEYMY